MRRMIALMAMLAAMLLSGTACAQTVTGFGLTVPDTATAIDLGEARVTDVDALAAFLRGLPALENVDMYESALTKEQMAYLSEAFPQITFGWTLRIAEHTVRTDATAFSTLHNHSSREHTSEDFEVLRYCKSLLALDLGHNAITDISFLSDLPNLRVLILGRNRVEDISVLAQLTQLEYAELFSNRITDLTPLSGLEHLIDLNLTNNPIRDFTPIVGLTGLRRLWCGMNGHVTRSVVSALTAALPDCEIDSESHPTGGTWRTHPNYTVINTMFTTGTYIPVETGTD